MASETGPIGPFATVRKAMGRLGLFCAGVRLWRRRFPCASFLALVRDTRKRATSCNLSAERTAGFGLQRVNLAPLPTPRGKMPRRIPDRCMNSTASAVNSVKLMLLAIDPQSLASTFPVRRVTPSQDKLYAAELSIRYVCSIRPIARSTRSGVSQFRQENRFVRGVCSSRETLAQARNGLFVPSAQSLAGFYCAPVVCVTELVRDSEAATVRLAT